MGGCCVGNFACCVIDLPCFFDSGCGDCCVGNTSEPTESEKHAKKIANELAEMKEKMNESTEKKENEIIDNVNKSMDSFMKEVDSLNKQLFAGESLRINTKAIREKNEALKKMAVGCVSNEMNRRLVQTDKELSTILEERDEKKRKKNFDKFIGRVQKTALEKFKKEVEKTVKAQSKVVSDEITARQKEVNGELEESIKELTAIVEIKNKNNSELEHKQVQYMYQSTLCELLLREVEGQV